MLEAALSGCGELGDTIEELLDVTRIEAGRLRLDLTAVDLAVTVNQSLRLLRPRFDDAQVGVRFLCGCPSDVVWGDASRLRTVLVNLLTNALKYSPADGTVTVEVSSGQNAGVGGPAALQVAVTDEGPGVPAEFRERIFEKFFRVEHHRGKGQDGVCGTGIGLYLCREIIKAHGGSIRCESAAGGIGTRVAFLLPTHALPG
jgi:NtrC-family two-component system sensor histidine kinase KinB